MLLLELAKDHLKLAEEEVYALSKTPAIKYKNFLMVDVRFPYERLTLTQNIFELQDSLPENLVLKVERYSVDLDSKTFTKTISALKANSNTINLSKPESIFALVKFKDNILFTKKIWSNPKTFLQRHPKSRPGFHPGACVPKFARVLVNLSGVIQGKILDPFCGTGGFMIESFDCGLDAYGSDINLEMIEKSKNNLLFYNMPAQVECKDAFKITGKYDAIITEVPFGKTTVIDRSVPKLVKDFLNHAKTVTNTVVISMPSNYRYSFLGWDKTLDEKWYLHKSLSKRIVVLKKLTP